MLAGAVMLTVSATLFVIVLVRSHFSAKLPARPEVVFATAVHQPLKVHKLLNSLTFWNWAMLVYMLASYGYPLAQFLFIGTPQTIPYGYGQ